MGVRNITNNGSKKVIGKFPSLLMGIIVRWESKLERDFIYLLEFDPDVLSYREQPIRIIYFLDGKRHRYTPDFLVVRVNKKQIIEVKPISKVFKGNNRRRFRAISRICSAMGYEFKIATEREIRVQPSLNNIKLFWKYARTSISPQHQIYCKEVFGNNREIYLGELIRAFESKGIGRQVVFSMLYHKILTVDLTQPVSACSIIQLAGANTLREAA